MGGLTCNRETRELLESLVKESRWRMERIDNLLNLYRYEDDYREQLFQIYSLLERARLESNDLINEINKLSVQLRTLEKGTTKEDLIKELGLEDTSFDYALPMDWINSVCSTLNIPMDDVTGNFVWMYDDGKTRLLFGAAYPLTEQGKNILRKLHKTRLYRGGATGKCECQWCSVD